MNVVSILRSEWPLLQMLRRHCVLSVAVEDEGLTPVGKCFSGQFKNKDAPFAVVFPVNWHDLISTFRFYTSTSNIITLLQLRVFSLQCFICMSCKYLFCLTPSPRTAHYETTLTPRYKQRCCTEQPSSSFLLVSFSVHLIRCTVFYTTFGSTVYCSLFSEVLQCCVLMKSSDSTHP